MKYIKTYKIFESILDKMVGMSEEEVRDIYGNMSEDDKIQHISQLVELGDLDEIKRVLEFRRIVPHNITVALNSCVDNDRKDILEYMLDNYKISDGQYNHLFRLACVPLSKENGRYEIAKFLLDYKPGVVDLNYMDGWILRQAVKQGDASIVKLLLDNGLTLDNLDHMDVGHEPKKKVLDIAKDRGYTDVIDVIERYKRDQI